MAKLFEVEIIVRAVIVADDDKHAQSVANNSAREIMREDSLDDICVASEITSLDDLPPGWSAPCIPFGAHGDRSIAQFLAELPPPAPNRDTKTIDMFAVTP